MVLSVVGVPIRVAIDFHRNGSPIDRQSSVHRFGHHVVAGAVLGLVQRHAGEGHIIGACVGAAAFGGHTIEDQTFHAGGEAAHGLFRTVIGLHAAVGGQRNGRRINGQGNRCFADGRVGFILRGDCGSTGVFNRKRAGVVDLCNVRIRAAPRPCAVGPGVRNRTGEHNVRIAVGHGLVTARDAHARIVLADQGNHHVDRGIFVVGGADGHGKGDDIALRTVVDLYAHAAVGAYPENGNGQAAIYNWHTFRVRQSSRVRGHFPGHGGVEGIHGVDYFQLHILERLGCCFADREVRGTFSRQLVVPRFFSGQGHGLSGIVRSGVGLCAADFNADLVAVDRSFCHCCGSLLLAVEGQRRAAPNQHDFFLFDVQRTRPEADLVVLGV